MYVDAAKCGLVADMGPENWQTLCVIASYMSEDRTCFPTQHTIAKGLNVRRETANRRISKLAKYRWQGRPVIEVTRDRAKNGKWDNARYKILPVSQLGIFESEFERIYPIHVTSDGVSYNSHGYTSH